jgi:uncharacterized protein YpbB
MNTQEQLEKELEKILIEKVDWGGFKTTGKAVKALVSFIQEREKALNEKINELTMANMTHEYNLEEANRTWPQFKKQIEVEAVESYLSSIEGQRKGEQINK